MTSPVNQPRTKTKPNGRARKREMTKTQKSRLIDRHVARVQKAESGTTAATWKLADAIAALIAAYKQCHKFPPSASKLQQITKLDRNGTRMQLMAKVATFFPSELRKPGVGVRVYETVYKANQSLKLQGRERFSADQLIEIMGNFPSAETAGQFVKWAAAKRDRPADFEEIKQVRDDLLAGRPNYKLTAKKWFKAYDVDPAFAIAAAIRLLPDEVPFDKINNALSRLGLDYRFMKPTPPRSASVPFQPFDDDDDHDVASDADAA